MQNLVLFTLLGLGSGALIAAIAVGIVLTYRGSGAINLATGSGAMLGAYVYFGLHVQGQLDVPPIPRIALGARIPAIPSILITIAVCALFGVLVERVIARPLRTATPLAKLI